MIGLFFLTFFLNSNFSSSTGLIEPSLKNIQTQIDDAINKGQYNEVLKLSDLLIQEAKLNSNDSLRYLYQVLAIGDKLMYYRNSSDWNKFEFVLNQYEALVINRLKAKPGEPDATTRQLNILLFRFILYSAKGDINKALIISDSTLSHLNNNLKLFESQGTAADISHRRYQLYCNRGDIFYNDHRYEQAKTQYLVAYNEALKTDKAKYESFRESWGYTGNMLTRLIKLANKTGQDSLVSGYLTNYEKIDFDHYKGERDYQLILALLDGSRFDKITAEKISKKVSVNPHASKDPDVYIRLANLFYNNNDFIKASEFFAKSRRLIKGVSFPWEYKLSLYEARLALSKKDWSSMEKLLENAYLELFIPEDSLSIWSKAGKRNEALVLLQSVLEIYRKAYSISCNNNYLLKSIKLIDIGLLGIEKVRHSLTLSDDRITLLDNLNTFVEFALDAFYEKQIRNADTLSMNDLNTVIALFELNKSFNLGSNRKFKFYTLNELERIKFNRLAYQQDSIQSILKSNTELNENLIKEYLTVSDLYNNFVERHGQNAPSDDFRLNDITNNLKEDESLVNFFTGKFDLFSLLIVKHGVKFVKQSLQDSSGHSITSDIESVIKIFSKPENFEIPKLKEEYIVASKKLYDFLIGPYKQVVTKQVILIPEANLSNIPFGALLTRFPTNQNCKYWPYWINYSIVSVQHSFSSWIDSRLTGVTKFTKSYEAVVFAPTYSDLSDNITEGNEIAKLFKPSKLFLGQAASSNHFFQFSTNSRIIHVASHARSDLESNLNSFIMLGADKVFLPEFSNKDVSADLVFLSACETGNGKVVNAEGVMSLARAFFNGGAKSVISTLWKVSDEQTSTQAIDIYKNLLNGQSKDQAIRNMQLDYIRKSTNSLKASPYYWAAYQCEGDLSPLFSTKNIKKLELFAFSPFLVFVFFAFGTFLLHKKNSSETG